MGNKEEVKLNKTSKMKFDAYSYAVEDIQDAFDSTWEYVEENYDIKVDEFDQALFEFIKKYILMQMEEYLTLYKEALIEEEGEVYDL